MLNILVVCPLVFLLATGDSASARVQTAPATTAAPATVPAQAVPVTPVTPAAPPSPNTLLDGTAVKLRLTETISSSNAKVGQQIPFEVTEDVMIQGTTVLPKGAQALASVTEANAKKSMGRAGKLNVNVDSARLADGEKVQLRAVQDNKGGGHVGAMTGAMVATAIVFFPAAPLFLFIHGKDVTIPKGTEITAFVQGDMRLDMTKFGVAAADAAPAVTAPAAPAVQTASLMVESSVLNCDIEIDGEFVGSTPSTLTVAPGKHAVTVKKTGYADWTRNMTVAAGSARLSAEMLANAGVPTPIEAAKP